MGYIPEIPHHTTPFLLYCQCEKLLYGRIMVVRWRPSEHEPSEEALGSNKQLILTDRNGLVIEHPGINEVFLIWIKWKTFAAKT